MMTYNAVNLQVEVADVLSRRCQLLVVKHAQYSYGLDAKIVEGMGLAPTKLPAPGHHLLLDSRGRLTAASVLFLGVPELDFLDYKEIRDFGRRALSVASEVAPDVPELCVTLHGPGYGLDEAESFESELAGLVDAVLSSDVSPNLEVVTFLERDQRRAERMDAILGTLLPARRIERGQPLGRGAVGPREAQRLRSVGYDSKARSHAFVAMPFAPSFDDIFHYGIAPSVHGAGLLCERIDQVSFTGDVVGRLRERIRTAKFVVADVTGANPNVYLEIGFAWGCEIPVVLVCNETSDLKFDIRGQRCLVYGSIRDLEIKLTQEIAAMFPEHAKRAYR
jgi:hypothetical protein